MSINPVDNSIQMTISGNLNPVLKHGDSTEFRAAQIYLERSKVLQIDRFRHLTRNDQRDSDEQTWAQETQRTVRKRE